MTGQSSDEKFRFTYQACQKIYIHDLLEILVGHVFCCKCHLSPEWRVGRLSAGCRWMRCFRAGQSCSADRGQRIYTHITAHNSPIRKNTRFTWKIPTLRGSPSHIYMYIDTCIHKETKTTKPSSPPPPPPSPKKWKTARGRADFRLEDGLQGVVAARGLAQDLESLVTRVTSDQRLAIGAVSAGNEFV